MGGGTVQVFPPGTVKAIRVADYTNSQIDLTEFGWVGYVLDSP